MSVMLVVPFVFMSILAGWISSIYTVHSFELPIYGRVHSVIDLDRVADIKECALWRVDLFEELKDLIYRLKVVHKKVDKVFLAHLVHQSKNTVFIATVYGCNKGFDFLFSLLLVDSRLVSA
jgi:hypothetical protein